MYDYILPEGAKIDINKLFDVLSDVKRSNDWYLNCKTGKVVRSKSKKPASSLIALPVVSEAVFLQGLEGFMELMLRVEAPEFAGEIEKALQKDDPLMKVAELFEADTDGWIHAWDQYKVEFVEDLVEQWFEELPFEVKRVFEPDDDCPICMAMKAAENLGRELIDEELKMAFEVANKGQRFE